jgi:hypothetical protein
MGGPHFEVAMSDPAIPQKFAYLHDVVRKYTFPHGDVAEYDELIDRLTPADVAELGQAYERLAADPDGVRELSGWIDEVERSRFEAWGRWLEQKTAREEGRALPGPAMAKPETPDPPQVFYLFLVFDLLRKKRLAPFKGGQVKFSPPPERLDWTKLPQKLRWLAGPAEKYGKHQFHGDRVRFAKRVKPEERAELAEVVRRLWSSAAILKEFQDWCAAHPASKGNPETELLNGMWELIVGIGEADGDPPR